MAKYAKDFLKNQIIKRREELGRVPTIKEMGGEYSSPYNYIASFGSWNNALKASGIEDIGDYDYSKKDLVKYLKRISYELGEKSTENNLHNKEEPSEIIIKKHFELNDSSKKNSRKKTNYNKWNIVTPEILSKAISYKFNEKDYLKMKNVSNIIVDLFGYETRIIDSPMNIKARSIFYILENEKIVSGENEIYRLFNGRTWKTHYWKLKTKNIIKYAKEYDISLEEKLQKEAEIPLEGDIYKKEEIWKRNIDIAK